MIKFINPINCNEYIPGDMNKLLFWMNDSYIFYQSCETCIKCGKCGRFQDDSQENTN